jgi:hypothetical protein
MRFPTSTVPLQSARPSHQQTPESGLMAAASLGRHQALNEMGAAGRPRLGDPRTPSQRLFPSLLHARTRFLI